MKKTAAQRNREAQAFIEVGATYGHSDFPNTRYLGCGEYSGLESAQPYSKKFLICLNYLKGHKVVSPTNADGRKWWSKFKLIERN